MGMVGGEFPGLLHGFQGLRALEPWGKTGFSTGFPQQAKNAFDVPPWRAAVAVGDLLEGRGK